MYVTVNNLPKSYKSFIVARSVDGALWFWGSWSDEERAHAVARKVDGIVVYAEEMEA